MSAAAVAVKTLEIYQRDDIFGHVKRIVPHFWKGLERFRDHPLVGEFVDVLLLLLILPRRQPVHALLDRIHALVQQINAGQIGLLEGDRVIHFAGTVDDLARIDAFGIRIQ